jgi:hypothetical protein
MRNLQRSIYFYQVLAYGSGFPAPESIHVYSSQTLEQTKQVIPWTRFRKTQPLFLIHQHISFFILRESDREYARLRGRETSLAPWFLVWLTIAFCCEEIHTKSPISVQNQLPTLLVGRSPSPPLSWITQDANVHACLKVEI